MTLDHKPFTLDYAFRNIGGRKAAIRLASHLAASDERMKALIERYRELTPAQKKHAPKLLEMLCNQVGIDPSEFLGACTMVAHKNQLSTAALLVSSALEDVVQAGIDAAKRPEGVADRKLIYEHSQFTPVKGPGIAIQVNQGLPRGGAALPEFKTLSEVALIASAQAALPPSTEEEEGAIDAIIESS